METGTLVILGQPVTFCLPPHVPVPRKGRCPGSGKGRKPRAGAPAAKPKVAPKKTTAPKPRAKNPAPEQPPQERKAREAEVDRLLKKPTHYGTPIGRIVSMFQDVAERLGWKLDKPTMKASFTNRNGSGDVELVPQGYKTTVTLPGKQPHSRIWKNPADAFNHVSSQLRRSELPG